LSRSVVLDLKVNFALVELISTLHSFGITTEQKQQQQQQQPQQKDADVINCKYCDGKARTK